MKTTQKVLIRWGCLSEINERIQYALKEEKAIDVISVKIDIIPREKIIKKRGNDETIETYDEWIMATVLYTTE